MLRLLTLDMLGGLLCALMICLCVVILRDGMSELPKFGLMFGLLCGINFVFYAMPVLGFIINGKSEQHVQPVDSADYDSGRSSHIHRLTYTLTVKTMPFFDPSRGFMYNAQSLGELLMPIAMLMGTYLGVSAHCEVSSHMVDLLGDDDDEAGLAGDHGSASGQHAGLERASYGTIFAAATGSAPPSMEAPKLHKAFSGTARKLAL